MGAVCERKYNYCGHYYCEKQELLLLLLVQVTRIRKSFKCRKYFVKSYACLHYYCVLRTV